MVKIKGKDCSIALLHKDILGLKNYFTFKNIGNYECTFTKLYVLFLGMVNFVFIAKVR